MLYPNTLGPTSERGIRSQQSQLYNHPGGIDIKGLRGGVGKGVEEDLRVRLWWDTSLIGGGDLQAMMLSYRLWNVSIDEVGCTSCACLFIFNLQGLGHCYILYQRPICDSIYRYTVHLIVRQLQCLACELIRVRDDSNHRDEETVLTNMQVVRFPTPS